MPGSSNRTIFVSKNFKGSRSHLIIRLSIREPHQIQKRCDNIRVIPGVS